MEQRTIDDGELRQWIDELGGGVPRRHPRQRRRGGHRQQDTGAPHARRISGRRRLERRVGIAAEHHRARAGARARLLPGRRGNPRAIRARDRHGHRPRHRRGPGTRRHRRNRRSAPRSGSAPWPTPTPEDEPALDKVIQAADADYRHDVISGGDVARADWRNAAAYEWRRLMLEPHAPTDPVSDVSRWRSSRSACGTLPTRPGR